MRWGRLVGSVALALLAGVACEDDAASPEGAASSAGAAGAGGAAGAAGVSNAAGASGEAGAPHLGGASAGGAGGGCEGDAALWAALTAAPPACESDDDCCVVVNSCLAEAQVVHANDFEVARTAWPYCEADCADCIPPVVRVSCDNGHCVGKVDSESLEDGVSHCGDTASMAGSPGQSFTCSDH
ncbi:MAG TPA: hypothetical protein VHP33_13675 [Polyangiaceae bacterium]|nr:hypothetical protein [Polyangiaceae bacterium]